MPLKQQSAKIHIPGVGNSFFGIEQGDSQTATADHYDFGISGFNADEARAKLRKRNLKFATAIRRNLSSFTIPMDSRFN